MQCEIKLPQEGAPAVAARSRSSWRPGPRLEPQRCQTPSSCISSLGVSTRPHSLESLRTHSSVLRACRFPFIEQGGPGSPASHRVTSPALSAVLAQVRGFVGAEGTGWGAVVS